MISFYHIQHTYIIFKYDEFNFFIKHSCVTSKIRNYLNVMIIKYNDIINQY